MIVFTPKIGRLIALDGVVSDEEVSRFGGLAMAELKERGAQDIIHHILRDCVEMTPHDTRYRTQRFSIRAVVMSEKELREEVEKAYTRGLYDGRKP